MDPRLFHILHLLGVIVLVGSIFAAFANPTPLLRRKLLSASGISSVVVVIAGFGLAGLLKYGFPTWIIIKIVCWLGLSGLTGLIFRNPKKIPIYAATTMVLLIVALYMVYFRPFS